MSPTKGITPNKKSSAIFHSIFILSVLGTCIDFAKPTMLSDKPVIIRSPTTGIRPIIKSKPNRIPNIGIRILASAKLANFCAFNNALGA